MDNAVEYGRRITDQMKAIPMNQFNEEVVKNLGPKIGGIWLMIGVGSWSEAAAFFAAVLSFLALAEWVWKKAVRPILVHFGKLPPPKRIVKMIEVEDE